MATLLADKYAARKAEVNERFEQLRANEEELNRIFAEIYNMVGEVPIEVEDKYVSVARIFDTAEEIPESYKGNVGDISMFIRIAVTGKMNSPDMYAVMQILGYDRVIERINKMLESL